jgi:hypothetical protein
VLLGATPGDDSAADIGTRPMSLVKQERRRRPPAASSPGRARTPRRGRRLGRLRRRGVDAPRAPGRPKERRSSGSSREPGRPRISYGCINVPVPSSSRSSGRCLRRAARSRTCCPKPAPSARSLPAPTTRS